MNDNPKIGKPLKRLDLNVPEFTANGKKYFIEGGLSIERYCEYQILEHELGHGMTYEQFMKKFNELHKALNKSEFITSAVIANGMKEGVKDLYKREPSMIKVCALFINEESEDRTQWSADLITKKINDWKIEGIDTRDFFALVLSLVPGLLENYNKVSQAIIKGSSNAAGSL